MQLVQEFPALLHGRLVTQFFDDFFAYGSGEMWWTNLAADGGVTAFAEGDSEHGRIQGATGATDNNEIAARSTNEFALAQADGAFIYEARIQYTEANTDDANVFVGLASAAGANLLVDDGAGVRTTGSIFGIYKIDGGTVWRCNARNGTTNNDTASVQTAGGASYQRLTIAGRATRTTQYEVTYFLDGAALTDSNNRPIKHTFDAITSATEMNVVAGYIKAGGANTETMNIDYCAFSMRRV